jgi:hypothetical protein
VRCLHSGARGREGAGQGSGNTGGNINQRISWRSVAHYIASSEGERGFSGESPELITPGSKVPAPDVTSPQGAAAVGQVVPMAVPDA